MRNAAATEHEDRPRRFRRPKWVNGGGAAQHLLLQHCNQCHPREAIERCAGEQYIQHNQVSLMARKGSSRISRKPVAITRVTAGSGGVCQRWGHRHRTARRTAASARRDAVGVIYPDLPRLTKLNLPPINAADYLISWQRLLGSLGKGIGGCALRPQLDRGPPRSWRFFRQTSPSAKPCAGTALRRISSSLARCAKVQIRFLRTPPPAGRVRARDAPRRREHRQNSVTQTQADLCPRPV